MNDLRLALRHPETNQRYLGTAMMAPGETVTLERWTPLSVPVREGCACMWSPVSGRIMCVLCKLDSPPRVGADE